MYVRMHTCTNRHTQTHTRTDTHRHTYTHRHTQTYVHTQTHTRTDTYIHRHIHTPEVSGLSSSTVTPWYICSLSRKLVSVAPGKMDSSSRIHSSPLLSVERSIWPPRRCEEEEDKVLLLPSVSPEHCAPLHYTYTHHCTCVCMYMCRDVVEASALNPEQT